MNSKRPTSKTGVLVQDFTIQKLVAYTHQWIATGVDPRAPTEAHISMEEIIKRTPADMLHAYAISRLIMQVDEMCKLLAAVLEETRHRFD